MADPYNDAYEEAGKAWNIDPNLIRAIHSGESAFKDSATSPKGAIGRGQFMPDTAAGLDPNMNPRDPLHAIFGTAKLMSENMAASKGDVANALRIYQGGPNTQKWGKENADYVPYIMQHYQKVTADQSATGANATYDAAVGKLRANDAQPSAAAAATSAPDPFEVTFSNVAPAQSATPASEPQNQPVDAFDAAFGNAPKAAPEVPPVADVASKNQPPLPTATKGASPSIPSFSPDETSALTTGLDRGMRNVVDKPAEWLARASDWTGLTSGEGNRVSAINADAKAAYEQKFGQNPLAKAAQVGGELASLGPALKVANTAVGVGGRLLGGNVLGDALTGQLGSGLARVPSMMAQGGIMGATAAGVTGNDVKAGAVLGAVGAPVAAGAMALGQGTANMLAGRGGGGMSPEIAKLAQEAQGFNIPLRADQISTTPAIKMAGDTISRLPFSGDGAFRDQQGQAFTRAVSGTFGEDATALTPSVMQGAKTRIGKMFDKVAANTPVTADTAFINDMGKVETEARKALSASDSERVSKQITDILEKVPQDGSAISGDVFQGLTRRNTPLDRLTQDKDPNVAYYGRQLKESLDDALGRSASPEMQKMLDTARGQWRNMKAVEQAVAKAPVGDVNPNLMLGRAMANDPNMAYTGGGDLGSLARIGKQFLSAPANSGTPERLATLGLLGNGLRLGIGAGTAVGTNVVGSIMRSQPVVNRLIQSGLNPTPASTSINQLAPYVAPSGVFALPQQSR